MGTAMPTAPTSTREAAGVPGMLAAQWGRDGSETQPCF